MTALLAVLAGTARLSRRDRAALTLALEALRRPVRSDWLGDAYEILRDRHGRVASEVGEAVRDAWPYSPRRMRARLALLLRLVLRCDQQRQSDEDWKTPEPAGGSPWRTPMRCSACRENVSGLGYRLGDRISLGPCKGAAVARAMPLWERAPATRAR